MKKIYTITFHRADNYGAMLQAFALQKALESFGYDAYILDYDNHFISDEYRLFRKKSDNIIKTVKNLLNDIISYKCNKMRIKNFKIFRNSIKIASFEELNQLDKYGIYIVGSDQVWNTKIIGGIDNIYFMNFNCNKKISYAASCGDVKNLKNNNEKIIPLLNDFDYISVRENDTKDYLNQILSKQVVTVVDPTLLLTKSQWLVFANNKRVIKERYIFIYSVGNATNLFYSVVNKIAQKLDCEVIYFDRHDFKHKIKSDKISCYKYGPNEFVNLLYNSELVITTSFHGTALASILNKKIMVTLSTYPDRLITLLQTLDLSNVIVKDENDIDRVYNLNIDWNKVNCLLELERKKSSDWLIKAIESDE